MDDLDVLARDFGFGTRGKSNPMRPTASDRRSIDDPLFSDVFGGEPKYTQNSNSRSTNSQTLGKDFDYDSIFKSSAATDSSSKSSASKISMPVYDKPVYDDDIFDGLPRMKSKSAASTVTFDNDIFAPVSIPKSAKSINQGSDFDDLLGNLVRNEKVREENINDSNKSSSSSKGFDDLFAGFRSGSSPARNRPTPETRWGSMPPNQRSTLGDPFVVLETSSTSHSPSGVSTDPLEEIGKLNKSKSARAEVSPDSTGVFDDLDPLQTFGKSEHSFSSRRDNSGNDGGHGNSAPQSASSQEPMGNFSYGYSESTMESNVPVGSFQEPQLFDMPNDPTDSQKFDQTTSYPPYYETGSNVDTPPASDTGGRHFDDIWLTVSEIPLFTQPSTAPPPSRPPPPIPHRTTRSEAGSFPSNYRKKGDESSSLSNHGQHFQSPKLRSTIDKGPAFSQFDELEDFSVNSSQSNSDGTSNLYSSVETSTFSTADESAAAMKYAMDKAEAKFRHAKEVREREHAKAARNKETKPVENDEQDEQERESKETQERLEQERKQMEEEAEQRRRERERLKEIEKEKGRQAVERATREARERAAAEARLKAERAAVGKANAEARERAERAAVQRAQNEARERAAAEAKVRIERAAVEARERAAAEAREREKEEQEKSARADAEARRRAERAAVERATAEARGRAAAEARERAAATAAAAAAARMNQQKNDNDLESFFSSGRASSAPKARTYSTDPLSEQFQSKVTPEPAKRTPPSTGTPSSMKKASSTTNFVDDLSSIFGAAPRSGDFQEVEGETEDRRRARLDRHQRTQERAAKALAEKNQRDLQAQRDQEERHRYAEMLDTEIKRWAAGKHGNLRALLSTLQYVLWPECGWQPVSLTDLITGASVKKAYRKATLCIHPDKVQQKGATLQQKYIAEKVFDLLKEAWNKFNSEELF